MGSDPIFKRVNLDTVTEGRTSETYCRSLLIVSVEPAFTITG
jgi:hypothetical protein